MELSKEAREIIWGPVSKIKEKHSTALMKEKKAIKIQPAREIFYSVMKDNIITGQDWKETIATLLVCASFQFGCRKKDKEKIMSWINKINYITTNPDSDIDMSFKSRRLYFNQCWRNLEKSGVFKNGKIYANFDGECDGIEFSLLICVAEGYIERSVRK